MSERVIKILMRRDRIDRGEAEDMVRECREQLADRLADGDYLGAEDVIHDLLGLEPDFLMELMPEGY